MDSVAMVLLGVHLEIVFYSCSEVFATVWSSLGSNERIIYEE
jgi:hypothetical protein